MAGVAFIVRCADNNKNKIIKNSEYYCSYSVDLKIQQRRTFRPSVWSTIKVLQFYNLLMWCLNCVMEALLMIVFLCANAAHVSERQLMWMIVHIIIRYLSAITCICQHRGRDLHQWTSRSQPLYTWSKSNPDSWGHCLSRRFHLEIHRWRSLNTWLS